MNGGVFIYVGQTQSGKTTKALEDARAEIRGDGLPLLVLDLGPARNFRGTRHESDRGAVLQRLYGLQSHAVYTPADMEDFDSLIQGIAKVGNIHVLLDEVRWVASHNHISLELTKALRHWAHGDEGPVTYRCTSQRPGDLHRDFYACLTGELYAFRTAPGVDLDRLVKEFHFDPNILSTLDRGAYLTYSGTWEEPKEDNLSEHGRVFEQGEGEAKTEPYETVEVPEKDPESPVLPPEAPV